jgi:uncharacterized protein YndB with AHSA1/START domain
VWAALATGEGLAQWFAPHARVEGGEGGSVWLSWGQGIEGTSKIEVWEPGVRLRTGEDWAGAHSTIEWTLTAQSGGRTLVRLVHSGFGPEAQWDEYYDGTTAGWTYFLRHLKHYVERFAGMERVLLHRRGASALPRAEAWSRILAHAGAEGAHPGDTVTVPLGAERVEGVIEVVKAPRAISFRFPALNDALLFVEIEPGETPHCGIWLSTYGLSEDRNASLQVGVDRLSEELSSTGAGSTTS